MQRSLKKIGILTAMSALLSVGAVAITAGPSQAFGTAFGCAQAGATGKYLVGQGTQNNLGPIAGVGVFIGHNAYSVGRVGNCLGPKQAWETIRAQNSVWKNGAPFISWGAEGCTWCQEFLWSNNWTAQTPGVYSNISAHIGRPSLNGPAPSFGILVPGANCTGNPVTNCS